MKLAWSLLLMLAAIIAAALLQDDDADELAQQAIDLFGGERP